MLTVPLLTSTPVADAWHQVTAPGGYEWWYFDAEDAGGELRMVAILFQGFVFHPGYLRKYAEFRRRPTSTLPPLPAQYPCAYFVLYRGNEIVGQFMSQFRAEDFYAQTDRVEVSIGPNRLSTGSEGELNLKLEGLPWVLTGQGPKTLHTQRLSCSFGFKPVFNHPPMERRFFARQWSHADHHWVIANPLCNVHGEIELADLSSGQTTRFSLNGQGYHDHNYGTGPIGPGLKRWMWGRVLMEDHVAMFHFAQPENAQITDDVHMLEADPFGMREVQTGRLNADWMLKTNTLLKYPQWVEVGPLSLVNPRMIDASPFYLRLEYAASVRGVTGRAFCEVAYPHRLRWPLLGRMIEMSIHRPGG